MKYTVYHNPRCSKSRMAVNYLEAQNKDFEVVEYLKDVPSNDELREILNKLDMKPEDLLRKGESIFKEKFKGKNLTEDQWITAMLENPKLIERPIVIKGNRAVVARPTEKIEEL